MEDLVAVSSTDQINRLQQLLSDHIKSIKIVETKTLTRPERSILAEKGQQFTASVFDKVFLFAFSGCRFIITCCLKVQKITKVIAPGEGIFS